MLWISSGHVWMWELDSIKKAELQKIDAFELWCWRRFLRVPWTARRSNQSILKEFSPGCSLVGLMLKLKLQYFGHLMWRADSLGKTLMLGKAEGKRRRGWQRIRCLVWHHRLNGHGFGWTPGVGNGQGSLACCGSWGHKVSDTTEWLNWTQCLPGLLDHKAHLKLYQLTFCRMTAVGFQALRKHCLKVI